MHLLRSLWFFSAFFEISIRAAHIPGALNTAADKLSRNQAAQFLHSHYLHHSAYRNYLEKKNHAAAYHIPGLYIIVCDACAGDLMLILFCSLVIFEYSIKIFNLIFSQN